MSYVCAKLFNRKVFSLTVCLQGKKSSTVQRKREKKGTGKSKKVNGIPNEKGERGVGKAVQFSFELLLLLLNWITTTDVSVSFLLFFYEMKCTPYYTTQTHTH